MRKKLWQFLQKACSKSSVEDGGENLATAETNIETTLILLTVLDAAVKLWNLVDESATDTRSKDDVLLVVFVVSQ